MKRNQKTKEAITGFINPMTGSYFEAVVYGQEMIDGKPFYVMKRLDTNRVAKMAVNGLKTTAVRVVKSSK